MFPELCIKNANTFFASSVSGSYPDIAEKTFQEDSFIFIGIFTRLVNYPG
jgi:hypothetical protein